MPPNVGYRGLADRLGKQLEAKRLAQQEQQGTPFVFGGPQKTLGRQARFLGTRAGQRAGQLDDISAILFEALGSPTMGAEAFLPFFEEAAQGAAAPALRDFQQLLSGTQANVASRFGGNVSSEELRVTRDASDDFSRNLTEALARVGPQAIGAAQNRAGILGGTRAQLAGEELDLNSLIARILGLEEELKGPGAGEIFGNLFGQLGGAAIGALA